MILVKVEILLIDLVIYIALSVQVPLQRYHDNSKAFKYDFKKSEKL